MEPLSRKHSKHRTNSVIERKYMIQGSLVAHCARIPTHTFAGRGLQEGDAVID